jgi:hypothetical protein
MTMIDEDEGRLPDVGGATRDAVADSILQQAAKKRQEREKTLFLDVPTWEGDLICEYEIIPKEELKIMAEKQQRLMRKSSNDDRLGFDLELIARASVGLYAIDPNSGDRVKIEDEFGHVGYDRIAAKLGVEEFVTSNSEAIRYLMGEPRDDGTWKDNVTAISRHASAIARWMKDPSRRGLDLEELLGEL